MRSILLDESVPRGVVKMLADIGAKVDYAPELGLAGVDDGTLLRSAAQLAVDVLVTCDQNLVMQQRIDKLSFGIVVLCTNNWPTILGNRTIVASACRDVTPGAYSEVLKGAHVTRYGRSPKLLGPG